MISLAPILEVLRTAPDGFAHPWFRQVGGAAEYAQIRPDALPLPAAWVVRAADRVTHAGEGMEDAQMAFDVVIAIANARYQEGVGTDEILLDYRRAVKDRLLAWQMEPELTPLKWAGGTVLEYTDGDLYWRDRYEFRALVTNFKPDPDGFGQLFRMGGSL